MENSREKLLEIVESEYYAFRENTLQKSKAEIFDDCYEIYFYTEIRSFLNDTELTDEQNETLIKAGHDGSLFGSLWDRFLKREYSSINNYEDIDCFISDYVDYLNENQEAM